ncbi:hypothetical protein [Rufibacter tibetensis]|uniref:Uncharacterized protein n=1 Tax=Rufibacter tibetensis TaxID=512763 RepID=A0A0P0CYG0_9BACT|nr:hypothetical protein [Rufibacter tibetensis]ALI99542.1 hypothetical protein DC20_11860 [Rufibacter tibetensis]
MDTSIKNAQRQGITYALKATLATEVVIAVLFFTLLLSVTSSVQMFLDIVTYLGAVNVVLFIISSLLFAYLIGRRAGVKILVRKKRHTWIGLFSGLKVVLFSTLVCSAAALLLQATTGAIEKGWLLNYMMKPFAWMAVLCLLPVTIAGLWYGYKLKSKLEL